jgi:TonB-linked SusC/RagA family outer membrane protein
MNLIRPCWQHRWRSSLAALLAIAMPVAANAQQQASLSGRVTEEAGQPVAYAQVFLVGTNVVVQTNIAGQYVIPTIRPGTVEVRVLRVGFQEQKKSVAITAGQPATLDFTLHAVAVQLQEVVTTATGQQRRVELGSSIATLGNINQRVEETPVTSMADLLVAKAPGVMVLPGDMTGTAGIIHIRGANSISLNNDPIWIVDGVRFNAGSVGFINGNNGQASSFLNGLDPEDIANIEIVKGPSAATLYGTDAANGVIVVTTKHGRAGPAQWNWFAEGGLVQDRNRYPSSYAIWGHTPADPDTQVRCLLQTISSGACIQDSVTTLNILADPSLTPFGTGHRQAYGMQVSGGSEAIRYFVSGDFQNEVGPIKMPEHDIDTFRAAGIAVRPESIHPEALQSLNLRANVSAAITPKVDLTINTGFVRTKQRISETDNSFFSPQFQALMSPGFTEPGLGITQLGSRGEELHGNNGYTFGDIFQEDAHEEIQRLVGSVTANWRPFTWMQNDATLGLDLANRIDDDICRFEECPDQGLFRQGFASSTHANDRNISAKVASNMSWRAKEWLDLRTTVGADYTNVENDNTNIFGQFLPPGAITASQAAVLAGGGNALPTASKTLGLFVQEQGAINDRLFLTVGVRSDQNSAFGTNFQHVFYPKASVSWIVSDESFFPKLSWLNQLRLRSTYGASGVQPGATASFVTFSSPTVNIPPNIGAASGTDVAGLRTSALGNPDLKPERSAEFEGGFDARVLDSRMNVEFTYYRKQTHDALINQALAPSSSASAGSVLRNLGSIRNSGIEASVNATLIDTKSLGWDVTLVGSHNTNVIVSLGADAQGNPTPTIGTGTQRDSVGLPINGLFYQTYTFADKNGDGFITKDEVTVDPAFSYVGQSIAPDNASLTTGFDLFGRKLRIQGMFDYVGGYKLEDGGARFQCQNGDACGGLSNPNASLADQAAAIAAKVSSTKTRYGYLEDGSFVRFRELSATFRAPNRLTGMLHAQSASLSFGARNLHVWTKYTGSDPEANFSRGDSPSDFASPAPRTYFTLRLNLHY